MTVVQSMAMIYLESVVATWADKKHDESRKRLEIHVVNRRLIWIAAQSTVWSYQEDQTSPQKVPSVASVTTKGKFVRACTARGNSKR